ncbi:hypothetical protein CR513_22040, partial [Mucuna pruriens]
MPSCLKHDVLTWRDVGSATGAAEPLKYTRRQTQKQRTVVASTSNKEKGKRVVEEVDADELSQDEREEDGYPAIRYPTIQVRGSAAPLRYLGLTTMIRITSFRKASLLPTATYQNLSTYGTKT